MANEPTPRTRFNPRFALVLLILAGGVLGAVLFRSEVPPTDTDTSAHTNNNSSLIHRSPAEPLPAAPSTDKPPAGTSTAPGTTPATTSAPATTAPPPRSEPHLLGRIEEYASAAPTAVPSMAQQFDPPSITQPSAPWSAANTSNQLLTPAPYSPRVGQAPPRVHKIVDGDTLFYLAERYLGRGERYMDIYHANRDVLTDPDILPIGRQLRIPTADTTTTSPRPYNTPPDNAPQRAALAPIPPGSLARDQQPLTSPDPPPQTPRTFQVRAGDTLADIARQVYGDARRHVEIYDANRDRLRGPEDLREGMVLVVP